jgi:hypothetical protein
MDFHQLLAKMQELDRASPVDQPVQSEDCGMSPPMPSTSRPETPPPSLSVNLNAHGLDDIEQIMKLIAKVNPDATPKEPGMPSLSAPPSIMSIKPELPPLKMLPDFDADNDGKIGGEMDLDKDSDDNTKSIIMKMSSEKDDEGSQPAGLAQSLDRDGDGDHDMDDHDAEKKDKEEAFGNSVDGSEPEYADISASIPDGNDMHKPKKSFSGKPYRGDNPMAAGAYESKEQLRASIREELLQRLAEAKGAK